MNTNINRKQKYIKIASEILSREGRDGISIRRIASDAGCTSAVLYKHFDNLDHLIMLASIHFLEPYMREMQAMSSRNDMTPIQLNMALWRVFLNEAFENKTYYEMMFVGPDRDRLRDCVREYYDIFSTELDTIDPVSASIIFSNDISKREYIRLKQASEQGLITDDNARELSRLVEAVFIGRLVKYDGSYSHEEASAKCYELIRNLYRNYVNKETLL